MRLSSRVSKMHHSPIRKFNKFAFDAEKAGKKVYRVNIGQPDIETPECFMEAVRNYDAKTIAYTESGGITALHDSIIGYYATYGIQLVTDDIMITNGGSEALSMVFTSILNEGDNVLVPEPFYTNYQTFLFASGGKVKPITTKAEDGFNFINRELIEAQIDNRTRAIVVSTPGNPTGAALSLDDMRVICEIAEEHRLWVIADEVYREYVFDNKQITSFAMLPEYADRIAIIDSVSKRYSSCGARIGAVITKNPVLMDGLMKIAEGRLCVSTLNQVGAVELFKLRKEYYDNSRAIYEARCNAAYEELMKIPGVVCHKPGGAFYMTAKLPVDNIEKFLIYLLTEFEDNGETVMFAPAEGFYQTPGLGSDEMRIAYVLNEDDMRRSVELIRLGIEAYNNRK
ncbi:MAG: pyridoxal phosphate-dependent aminotransferase [Eubacterium sp.]|nr:pyridoxal phosphate-dependent aminotransferase [Candidatus Colimonas fimequi]